MRGRNNWWENRNFSFTRLPKAFWENERYRHLSTDAIMLYSLMLDRMGLSKANEWKDEKGEVYIYFTLDEIQRKMRCSRSKACKLKQILLKEKLIRFEQRGKADPHRIYVLPFFSGSENRPVKSENDTSCSSKTIPHEVYISDPNNPETNNTKISNIYPSREYGKYEPSIVREILMENLGYDTLPGKDYDMDLIDTILDVMVDAICCTGAETKIGKETVSRDMVRSRFFHFTLEDLEYVLYCLKNNTADIRNMRSYMLVTLYYAPATKDLFYRRKFQRNWPSNVTSHQKGGM